MNTTPVCEKCGAPLPADAPRGLCPRCMMHAALEATVEAPQSSSAAASFVPVIPAAGLPAPGAKLRYFGDYELLEKIAQGGMGVVYKARQVSLNRTVAVKMILGGQLAGEAEIQRFLTEAEAAANLQHPNIVAIHEVGQHEEQYYFSMDCVEGKNLGDFTRENPLPPNKTASLVKTIAEAVHYAHQRGTLHRDLKPQNVLMDANGQPHLTDFGLAKRLDRDSGLTQSGAVLGSPSFMPPEQAAGRHGDVGPASDVYSLGAILYQLLTGKPPFAAATPLEIIRQVVEADPRAPSKLNSSVPPDLETICLKCLEKKPERRYATACALAEELGRFLNHEPILAKPASSLRKAWSWSQRHPWAMTGAAALLIVGLLGFAYGLWQGLEHLKWRQGDQRALTWFEKATTSEIVILMSVEFGLFIAAVLCSLEMRHRRRRNLTLPASYLVVHTLVGLLLFGVALFIGSGTIRDYVWYNNLSILSGRLLFAALVAWAGIHLISQAFLQQRGLLTGSEHKGVEPFVEEFRMNYFAFAITFGIVNLLFSAAAYLWIPAVVGGRGRAVFVASLISTLPWLLAAFRMSTGQVRAFFGVSFCLVLLMGWAKDLDTKHLYTILAAGLIGGLVMLRAAKMRKLGPMEKLSEAPISAFSEGLTWDGKAFLLTLVLSVVALVGVARLLFSGRAGEIFPDQSGDFLIIAVIIMFLTAVFMTLRAWRPQAPAAGLFLSIGALGLFVVVPLFGGLLEGNKLPPVFLVSAYAAGFAAGFALIKFGKIRKKQ